MGVSDSIFDSFHCAVALYEQGDDLISYFRVEVLIEQSSS